MPSPRGGSPRWTVAEALVIAASGAFLTNLLVRLLLHALHR